MVFLHCKIIYIIISYTHIIESHIYYVVYCEIVQKQMMKENRQISKITIIMCLEIWDVVLNII